MVATDARKARRIAAALALTGKADATAHVKPTPAAPQAARDPNQIKNPNAEWRGGQSKTDFKLAQKKPTPVFVGVGSKTGGNYTPPAILRAVANAAKNKTAKTDVLGGGEGGEGGDNSNPSSQPEKKADWLCKCGGSNFVRRRECFKCHLPKPGRKFTAAGVKGYEKRQQKRAEKVDATGGEGDGEEEKKETRTSTPKPETNNSAKRKFADPDGRDGDGGVPADTFNDDEASQHKKSKKQQPTTTRTEKEKSLSEKQTAKKPKGKLKKARDVGVAPKKLRDPTEVFVYLEGWATAVGERTEKGIALEAGGFKPTNGWKLDKNIQNWLLHNAFDPEAVDEDVFAMTLLYAGGLEGGPLERTREMAREKNVGKGVTAERARAVLRALAD